MFFTRLAKALILIVTAVSAGHAGIVTLEDTIPSGNLLLQPPVLTGAAPVFGVGGGAVVADGFTAPISAQLFQISLAVEYEDFPTFGVTGTSPMLLSLFMDSGDSPGTLIESWTVPLSPSDVSLTVVTVDSITHSLLLAGQQYWLSEVPTDPVGTGIGWGLASAGLPGIELPIAETNTGVNSGWGPTGPNIANEFSVSGTTVPEPATFGIDAFVLLLLIAGPRSKWRTSRAGGSTY
jgi:hypothetical protein